GPMNVYEEERYPFLRDEDRLIKQALETGAPVLGICLGAQLIAKAAGARVWQGPEKEIGWGEVRLTEEGRRDPLFKGFPLEFPVFHWHGDSFDLPSGAVPLAENDLYLQAFRLGGAIGLQFHLEVTAGMIRSWLSEYHEETKGLGRASGHENILEETEGNIESLNSRARMFMERWLAMEKY
ncbi:MAG: type 1 glutamine amidotransferase, partial [Methanobacteriota archaeon]